MIEQTTASAETTPAPNPVATTQDNPEQKALMDERIEAIKDTLAEPGKGQRARLGHLTRDAIRAVDAQRPPDVDSATFRASVADVLLSRANRLTRHEYKELVKDVIATGKVDGVAQAPAQLATDKIATQATRRAAAATAPAQTSVGEPPAPAPAAAPEVAPANTPPPTERNLAAPMARPENNLRYDPAVNYEGPLEHTDRHLHNEGVRRLSFSVGGEAAYVDVDFSELTHDKALTRGFDFGQGEPSHSRHNNFSGVDKLMNDMGLPPHDDVIELKGDTQFGQLLDTLAQRDGVILRSDIGPERRPDITSEDRFAPKVAFNGARGLFEAGVLRQYDPQGNNQSGAVVGVENQQVHTVRGRGNALAFERAPGPQVHTIGGRDNSITIDNIKGQDLVRLEGNPDDWRTRDLEQGGLRYVNRETGNRVDLFTGDRNRAWIADRVIFAPTERSAKQTIHRVDVEAANLVTRSGHDNVKIDGLTDSRIDTQYGNDRVRLSDVHSSTVQGGEEDDRVRVKGDLTGSRVQGNANNDHLLIKNADVRNVRIDGDGGGTVRRDQGDDLIELRDVSGRNVTLREGAGNGIIDVRGGHLRDLTVKAGAGDDQVFVDSRMSGDIELGMGRDSLMIGENATGRARVTDADKLTWHFADFDGALVPYQTGGPDTIVLQGDGWQQINDTTFKRFDANGEAAFTLKLAGDAANVERIMSVDTANDQLLQVFRNELNAPGQVQAQEIANGRHPVTGNEYVTKKVFHVVGHGANGEMNQIKNDRNRQDEDFFFHPGSTGVWHLDGGNKHNQATVLVPYEIHAPGGDEFALELNHLNELSDANLSSRFDGDLPDETFMVRVKVNDGAFLVAFDANGNAIDPNDGGLIIGTQRIMDVYGANQTSVHVQSPQPYFAADLARTIVTSAPYINAFHAAATGQPWYTVASKLAQSVAMTGAATGAFASPTAASTGAATSAAISGGAQFVEGALAGDWEQAAFGAVTGVTGGLAASGAIGDGFLDPSFSPLGSKLDVVLGGVGALKDTLDDGFAFSHITNNFSFGLSENRYANVALNTLVKAGAGALDEGFVQRKTDWTRVLQSGVSGFVNAVIQDALTTSSEEAQATEEALDGTLEEPAADGVAATNKVATKPDAAAGKETGDGLTDAVSPKTPGDGTTEPLTVAQAGPPDAQDAEPLERNYRGEAAVQLKEDLAFLGITDPQRLDGGDLYGYHTELAIENIQTEAGLPINGEADAATLQYISNRVDQLNEHLTLPIVGMNANGQTVVDVQEILSDGGFYTGETDGVYGNLTREAVSAYQDERGLTVTGVVDGHTARDMQVYREELRTTQRNARWEELPSFSFEPKPNSPVLFERGARGAEVRQVQELLTELNYSTGAIDGDLGNDTTYALTQFQEDALLPATGLLTQDTWDRLHEAVASKRSFEALSFDPTPVLSPPSTPFTTSSWEYEPPNLVVAEDGMSYTITGPLFGNEGQTFQLREPVERPAELSEAVQLEQIRRVREDINRFHGDLVSGETGRSFVGRWIDERTGRVDREIGQQQRWLDDLERDVRRGRLTPFEYESRLDFIAGESLDYALDQINRDRRSAETLTTLANIGMSAGRSAADTAVPGLGIVYDELNQIILTARTRENGVPHTNLSAFVQAYDILSTGEVPSVEEQAAVQQHQINNAITSLANFIGGNLPGESSTLVGQFGDDVTGAVASNTLVFGANAIQTVSDMSLTPAEQRAQLQQQAISTLQGIGLDSALNVGLRVFDEFVAPKIGPGANTPPNTPPSSPPNAPPVNGGTAPDGPTSSSATTQPATQSTTQAASTDLPGGPESTATTSTPDVTPPGPDLGTNQQPLLPPFRFGGEDTMTVSSFDPATNTQVDVAADGQITAGTLTNSNVVPGPGNGSLTVEPPNGANTAPAQLDGIPRTTVDTVVGGDGGTAIGAMNSSTLVQAGENVDVTLTGDATPSSDGAVVPDGPTSINQRVDGNSGVVVGTARDSVIVNAPGSDAAPTTVTAPNANTTAPTVTITGDGTTPIGVVQGEDLIIRNNGGQVVVQDGNNLIIDNQRFDARDVTEAQTQAVSQRLDSVSRQGGSVEYSSDGATVEFEVLSGGVIERQFSTFDDARVDTIITDITRATTQVDGAGIEYQAVPVRNRQGLNRIPSLGEMQILSEALANPMTGGAREVGLLTRIGDPMDVLLVVGTEHRLPVPPGYRVAAHVHPSGSPPSPEDHHTALHPTTISGTDQTVSISRGVSNFDVIPVYRAASDVDVFHDGQLPEASAERVVRPWRNRPPERAAFPIFAYPHATPSGGGAQSQAVQQAILTGGPLPSIAADENAAPFELRQTIDGSSFVFTSGAIEHYRPEPGVNGVRFVNPYAWFLDDAGRPQSNGAVREGYLGVMEHLRNQGFDEVQFVDSVSGSENSVRTYDIAD